MKKSILLEALEGIRDELRGIKVALVEREKDINRKFFTLESEQRRLDRRQVEVERRLSRAGNT